MDRTKNAASIMGKNCNPPWEQMVEAWYSDVTTQVGLATSMGWGVVGNERMLGPSLPYGKYVFITSLRHPFDRLISHYYNSSPLCRNPLTNEYVIIKGGGRNMNMSTS